MNKTLSDQNDWDQLLDFITDHQLTPILGKEIYKFKKNDILIPVDEYLSEQLLESNHITGQPALSLFKAVNYLVNEKKIRTMDITRKLKSLVKEIHFEFPLLTQ